ncbi:biotin/lipoyl-binding protein [archaeon]|nr:MAG: biotin/lipoyl-binding protein [archaeon]
MPKHAIFGTLAYLQALKDVGDAVWNGQGEFFNWRNALKTVNRAVKIKDGKETIEVMIDGLTGGKYRLSPTVQEEREDKLKHPNVHKPVTLRSINLVREAISEGNVRVKVLESSMEIEDTLVSGTTCLQFTTQGDVNVDVWINGETGENPTHYSFTIQNPAEGKHTAAASKNPLLLSPMPGKIVKVLVPDGAEVTQGQPIVILEAMKMEHIVSAPSAG